MQRKLKKAYVYTNLKSIISIFDEQVFHEFAHDKARLHAIARQIRQVAANPELKRVIYTIEDDEQTVQDKVTEGQILYKLHKVRERDRRIIQRKKEQALDIHGRLYCEACAFDYQKTYGMLGQGYIECHHRTPMATLEAERETTLSDLALVCANCHRMLHRSMSHLTLEGLRQIIRASA